MASRRPLSARNVDHTQGRGKPKKERHPFALLDRATLVQNLRHLTKDSSFPVNVCEDDLLKPAVSVVTLIMICSSRGIVKLSWKYIVVCPFGMSSIYKSHKFLALYNYKTEYTEKSGHFIMEVDTQDSRHHDTTLYCVLNGDIYMRYHHQGTPLEVPSSIN